jgi:hypothetical protein
MISGIQPDNEVDDCRCIQGSECKYRNMLRYMHDQNIAVKA